MKTGTRVRGVVTRITSDGLTFTYDEVFEGFIPRQEFDQNGIEFGKYRIGDAVEVLATKEKYEQKRVFGFVHVTNSGRVVRTVAEKQPIKPPLAETPESFHEFPSPSNRNRAVKVQEKASIEVTFHPEVVKQHAPKAMETEVFQGFIKKVEYINEMYVLKLSKSTFLQDVHLADRYTLSYNGKPFSFQKQMKFWADGLLCTEEGEPLVHIKDGSATVQGVPALGIIPTSEFSEKELRGLESSNSDSMTENSIIKNSRKDDADKASRKTASDNQELMGYKTSENAREDDSIINLFDIKLKKAYDWAIGEQKRYGFIAQPVRFEFEKDELTYDQESVYVSVFYDKESKEAIMRRDWDSSFVVQYNVLVNYEELTRIAPNSLRTLLMNGIDLYHRYLHAGF